MGSARDAPFGAIRHTRDACCVLHPMHSILSLCTVFSRSCPPQLLEKGRWDSSFDLGLLQKASALCGSMETVHVEVMLRTVFCVEFCGCVGVSQIALGNGWV